jgi:hypothetical protein
MYLIIELGCKLDVAAELDDFAWWVYITISEGCLTMTLQLWE